MIRVLVTWLAVVVVAVASLAFAPASWAASQLADEDGWVELSATVAADRQVQRSTANLIAENAISSDASWGGTVRGMVADLLDDVFARASVSPGFDEAWEQTQRESHRWAFADDPLPDQLIIELAPMADFGLQTVIGDLGLNVSAPQSLPVVAVPDGAQRTLEWIDRSPGLRVALAFLVIVAAVVAVVAARRVSMAVIGVGAAIAAAALFWILVGPEILSGLSDSHPDQTELGREFAAALAEPLSRSADQTLIPMAIGGAVLVVLGLVGRVVGGHRA